MKESKHIDRIFQEKLKDFDATPKDALWERINSELHQDGTYNKVFPIWWKIAGIAASLLLMVTVGYSVLNNDSEGANDVPVEIVDTNSKSNTDSTKDKNDTEKQDSQENNTSDELLKNNLIPKSQTTSSDDNDSKQKSLINSDANEAVANSNQLNSDKDRNNDKSKTNDVINNASNLTNIGVAGTKQTIENKTTYDSNKKSDNYYTKETFASSNQLNNKNRSNDKSKVDDIINNAPDSTNKAVAGTKQNAENKATNASNKNNTSNITVANNETPQNLPEQPTYKNNASKELKNVTTNSSNTTGGIAATDNTSEVKKEDINNNTGEAKISIEESIAKSEDGEDFDEKEKEVINRWSLAANVSPVYYNTLGKGSSIHDEFNTNSKNGQLNMAYGVNASYAISDKLSVRSGIGRVNVGYNTNDVLVYNNLGTASPQPVASANGAVFRNIDLKEEAQGITIISGETLAFAQVPGVVSENFKSTLNQEISFIEIPVELEYKLSDKKLGVSLIGGFSTMILDGNEVYTQLNDERRLLGEANNINTISYSANLGVGLGVKISEKINLNFEPNFKYQIKTFNNATGDFKPYIIGVNSGLKFKF